jgi:hypothetical protein
MPGVPAPELCAFRPRHGHGMCCGALSGAKEFTTESRSHGDPVAQMDDRRATPELLCLREPERELGAERFIRRLVRVPRQKCGRVVKC